MYGEHFVEHLAPSDALAFAREAARALRRDGVLRLSTPSLEHVWVTHFHPVHDRPRQDVIAETYKANRAFHGWGHRFLFSREMLEHLLLGAGFTDVTFHDYGASDHEELRGLERHGGWSRADGWPSVWNVEASAPGPDVSAGAKRRGRRGDRARVRAIRPRRSLTGDYSSAFCSAASIAAARSMAATPRGSLPLGQ